MRKSIWVVLAILAALATPRVSYAQEIDYLQSLSNGFQTLSGETQNEQVTPERDYEEEYEPVLMETREGEVAELTPFAGIQQFANGVSFQWDGSTVKPFVNFNLIFKTRPFLIMVVSIAVLFVFFWWGVRKAKSIIWTAFRTGRLNLGTSVKRAYYRRKAKEWYG